MSPESEYQRRMRHLQGRISQIREVLGDDTSNIRPLQAIAKSSHVSGEVLMQADLSLGIKLQEFVDVAYRVREF